MTTNISDRINTHETIDFNSVKTPLFNGVRLEFMALMSS